MKDFWYWLKCFCWHRYNVVVCRALEPTWHDRDDLLLFAAFQILEDFVEKEQPSEFTEDVYATYLAAGGGEELSVHRDRLWRELRLLHAWWQERKQDVYGGDDDTDDQMLHRLIDIRGLLWT